MAHAHPALEAHRLSRRGPLGSLHDLAERVLARARRPMFVEIAFVWVGPPVRGARVVQVEPRDSSLATRAFELPVLAERDRPWPDALREAAQRHLHERDRTDAMRSFVGRPFRVGDGDALPVLRYAAAAYDAQPTLRRLHLDDGHPRCRSLLDGIASTLLLEATRVLRRAARGEPAYDPLSRDPDDVLRSAGRALMAAAGRAAGQPVGITGLFDEVNQMASLLYEGREASGRMILAAPDHPSIRRELVLRQPVPLGEPIWARKMLEMSTSAFCLLTDAARVHALGGTGEYDADREDLFVVEFDGARRWALRHARRPLMHVLYGIPSLPEEPFDAAAFREVLLAYFGELPEEAVSRIWSVVRRAPAQRYGALLVVAEHAREEARRLANQAAAIEPRVLTGEMIDRVTQIDGAVLLDASGLCHAVGVILDGAAAPDVGSPARGARYNAAARYVRAVRGAALAVVVSEDGTVDVVGGARLA